MGCILREGLRLPVLGRTRSYSFWGRTRFQPVPIVDQIMKVEMIP